MTPAPARAGFVDALRAVALVGICVVNLPFLALPLADPALRGLSGPLDLAAATLVAALFEGKFFLLFSFLFGWGVSILAARVDAGAASPASFARRLLGLFALGALHALLLFIGDILTAYALLGGVLWLLRGRPDATLLRVAAGLVVLAAPLMALSGGLAAGAGWLADAGGDPAAAALAAYRDGSFWEAARFRLTELPLSLPFIALFNWPLALAAFLLGLVAGRRGLLDDPARLAAVLAPRARALALVAVLGNGAYALSPWLPPSAAAPAVASLAVAAPALSALYVLALARLWARNGAARRLLDWLAPAGRMSMTNYLGQSVVANLLFMGWGLGLYGALGRAALLGLALALAFGLVALSRPWLRRFRSGPEEWLLRSWTALAWQPFRR